MKGKPFTKTWKRRESILLLVVHGMGSNRTNLQKNKEDFIKTLNFIKHYWFWEIKVKIRVEFIDWKEAILVEQVNLLERVLPSSAQTPQTFDWTPNPRHLLNNALSDLMFYMTPQYGNMIVENAISQLNTYVADISKKRKSRITKIFLVGHSLGSVILHEILTGQVLRPTCAVRESHLHQNMCSNSDPDPMQANDVSVAAPAEYEAYTMKKTLTFSVDGVFYLGSPLAAFFCLFQSRYSKVAFPQGIPLYNMYHPHDPVAFRMESLYYTHLNPLPPSTLLPYWKNNGRRNYVFWKDDAKHINKFVTNYMQEVAAFAKKHINKLFHTQLPPRDTEISEHDRDTLTSSDTILKSSEVSNVMEGVREEERQHDAPQLDHSPSVHKKLCSTQQGSLGSQDIQHPVRKAVSMNIEREKSVEGETPIELFNKRFHTMNVNATGGEDEKNPCKNTDNSIRSLVTANSVKRVDRDPPSHLVGDYENVVQHVLGSRHHYQPINAGQRYGRHDKKPRLLLPNIHNEMNEKPKRLEGATLARVLEALDLDVKKDTVRDLVTQILRHSAISSFKSLKLNQKTPKGPKKVEEECDFNDELFSECEVLGGLELPVRLDFELQELTVEHYVTTIGPILSHFNYWTSKDTAFFLLKQATSFRPRVTYPDFLKLLDLSQKLNPPLYQESNSSLSSSRHMSDLSAHELNDTTNDKQEHDYPHTPQQPINTVPTRNAADMLIQNSFATPCPGENNCSRPDATPSQQDHVVYVSYKRRIERPTLDNRASTVKTENPMIFLT